jgi:hypothetical protein
MVRKSPRQSAELHAARFSLENGVCTCENVRARLHARSRTESRILSNGAKAKNAGLLMMVMVKNEQTAKACLFIFEGWRALYGKLLNFRLLIPVSGRCRLYAKGRTFSPD